MGTSPISTNITSEDGYTIGTSPLPGIFTNSTGADGNLSFWELPLWIQIAWASSALLGLFALIKISPLVIGKIRDVLENRNREKIYGYVVTHPGSTVRDITRDEDINLGTVKYHIGILETAHKITTKRFKKFIRIFQNSSTYNEKEKIIISDLAVPAYKSIIVALIDNPGMTNRQISEMLEISDSGSYQHMKRLLYDGIVRFERDGLAKKYYVNDDAKELIDRLTK